MKKKYSRKFNERLKERRDELGFTREELADRANLSKATIKSYEIGVRYPLDMTSLAQALSVSVDWLSCKTDDMSYDEKQALINRILYDKKEQESIQKQKKFDKLPDDAKSWIKEEQKKQQLSEPEIFDLIVSSSGRSLRVLQKEILTKYGMTNEDFVDVLVAYYSKILGLVRDEYDNIRENIHDRHYFHRYVVDNTPDEKGGK